MDRGAKVPERKADGRFGLYVVLLELGDVD